MAEPDTAGVGAAIGIVGLGRMGGAMAARLAGAGMLAGVQNRTWSTCREVADRLEVRAFASPAELAAECDVVITMLADESALWDVYDGPSGLLSGLRPETLCVDMGTTGPEPLARLAELIRARGGSLVDAPVSGSTELAASGQLTILAGGSQTDVDRAREMFAQLARRTFHLGALGTGAMMKLAVNNVIYGLNQSVAESLVLAERAGIERCLAYDVFADSAVAAPFVEYRRALFERPDTEAVQMRLDLAIKDIALIEALASKVGARLPQATVNLSVLRAATTAGHSARDVTAVAEYLRSQPAVDEGVTDVPSTAHQGSETL